MNGSGNEERWVAMLLLWLRIRSRPAGIQPHRPFRPEPFAPYVYCSPGANARDGTLRRGKCPGQLRSTQGVQSCSSQWDPVVRERKNRPGAALRWAGWLHPPLYSALVLVFPSTPSITGRAGTGNAYFFGCRSRGAVSAAACSKSFSMGGSAWRAGASDSCSAFSTCCSWSWPVFSIFVPSRV